MTPVGAAFPSSAAMTHDSTKLDRLLHTMRQGAAGIAAAQAPAAMPRPAPEAAAPATQVHRLMLLIEAHFGIHPSARMEQKLAAVFGHTSEESLKLWVDHMASLPSSDSGWYSVVETLTVHETYFCRDRPLLWMFGGDILPMLFARKKAAGAYSLRIWSAGCSTGEETYNLAMLILLALAEAGEATVAADGEVRANPRWRIEIVGTDVSRQVVRIAEAAVYADFAMGPFRDMPESRRSFFEGVPAAEIDAPLPGVSYYRVRPFVKRLASFRHHNLLSGQAPGTGFDIVLCRNVLIYFMDEAKRRVQDMFHRALAPGGVLLLGSADTLFATERYERRFGDGGAWYVKH